MGAKIRNYLFLFVICAAFAAGALVMRLEITRLPQEHRVVVDVSGLQKVQTAQEQGLRRVTEAFTHFEEFARGMEAQVLLRDGAWVFRFHQLIDRPKSAFELLLPLIEEVLDKAPMGPLEEIMDMVSDGAIRALGGPDIWGLYQRLLQKTSVAELRSAYVQVRPEVLRIAKAYPNLISELQPMAFGPMDHSVATEVVGRLSGWYCFSLIEVNDSEWENCQAELARFKDLWRLPEWPTENQVTFAAFLVNQEREGGPPLRELVLYVLRDVAANL